MRVGLDEEGQKEGGARAAQGQRGGGRKRGGGSGRGLGVTRMEGYVGTTTRIDRRAPGRLPTAWRRTARDGREGTARR